MTKCNYCGANLLSDDAVVCSKCQRHQGYLINKYPKLKAFPWTSWFSNFASMAGILTCIAGIVSLGFAFYELSAATDAYEEATLAKNAAERARKETSGLVRILDENTKFQKALIKMSYKSTDNIIDTILNLMNSVRKNIDAIASDDVKASKDEETKKLEITKKNKLLSEFDSHISTFKEIKTALKTLEEINEDNINSTIKSLEGISQPVTDK